MTSRPRTGGSAAKPANEPGLVRSSGARGSSPPPDTSQVAELRAGQSDATCWRDLPRRRSSSRAARRSRTARAPPSGAGGHAKVTLTFQVNPGRGAPVATSVTLVTDPGVAAGILKTFPAIRRKSLRGNGEHEPPAVREAPGRDQPPKR